MADRKYALIRIEAGDYLLPSNDGKVLWRIMRGEEDDGTGRFYSVWQVWRWVHSPATTRACDLGDWEQWEMADSFSRTRQNAINNAMRMGEAS